MSRVLPRQPAPELVAPTLSGTTWSLAAASPQRFSLIVFYRGLHCPICKTYIAELDKLVPEFATRGVETIAMSSDTEARARQAQTSWGLSQLLVGHSLTIGTVRAWGLYISTGRGMTSSGVEEPSLFSEPGMFLVRPDHTLYWASVQSMPFARPHFRDVVAALDFVIAKDYPARGEA
ncbi:MAG TPA: peroxiredoxin-like family protein [Casimicrobiaceae bacterium]|jgi:peroxiredoxin|nr:peroxiredoxin-like family protein [Casimicrobiaceae bacterium]